jgi:hypothetical protein
MRSAIDWRRGFFLLRLTKTEAAARAMPIVGASFDLLERAAVTPRALVVRCSGRGATLVAISATRVRTRNQGRADIAPLHAAPNLRLAQQNPGRRLYAHASTSPRSPGLPERSPPHYATWLRQHGTEPHLIAVALGHTDSRMAERVYGRVPVESLGRMLAERVGDSSAFVANTRSAEASRATHRTARTR